MNKIKEIKECRLCGSDKIESVLNFGETASANAYRKNKFEINPKFPLEVVLCNNCGSAQLKHTINPEYLFGNYLYQSSHNPVLVNHMERLADEIKNNYLLFNNDLVVDIGGNCGILSKIFKDLGYKALNVDPAANLVKISESRGIETINEFFTRKTSQNIVHQYGKASVITCLNCFAHIPDLNEVMEGVKILIKSDGYFIFENSYLLSVVKNNLMDIFYHDHVYTHSIRPLNFFLNNHGFYIYKIDLIDIQGGSYRICCGPNKNLENRTVISSFIHEEICSGLYNSESYKNWMKKNRRINDNLKILCTGLYKMGHDIVVYGAPAKATTLLNILGISNYISFCVDDSPYKIGKFMPDFDIEIKDVNYWKDRNPAYTLILAWNYADSIIAKNQEYLKLGGNFVVPFPSIKIV